MTSQTSLKRPQRGNVETTNPLGRDGQSAIDCRDRMTIRPITMHTPQDQVATLKILAMTWQRQQKQKTPLHFL